MCICIVCPSFSEGAAAAVPAELSASTAASAVIFTLKKVIFVTSNV